VGVTSTVLDGVLCLLLVSAAVVTVTAATPTAPAGGGRAADVTSTLATTTAAVNYTLTPRPSTTGVAFPSTNGAAFDRTAHGTLAGLLARAAVGRVSLDGRQLWHTRDGFGRAVARAVRGAVRSNHTRVTAVWRPYPGSSVEGRMTVGGRPPPDVPVHAATLTVSSGVPSGRAAVGDPATRRDVAGVADVVAGGIVRGLFPPIRTRVAAGGAYPASALVRHRYRLLQRRVGVDRSPTLADGGVDESNARVADALSDRVANDLRRAGASPDDVAAALRLGRVRITVRTWP
jgi:hypothetical protein